MTVLVCLLLAYLLGSLSGALILGRWQGVDIRRLGSGNAGGTNALRTRGWRFALGVVGIDIGKGGLAGLLPQGLGVAGPGWLPYACVLAAVAGHVWPLFFEFRGGKGMATLLGGLAAIWLLALLGVLAVWSLVLIGSGYVGLATVVAAAALLPLALLDPGGEPTSRLVFAAAAALLVLYTHRGNLQRLRAGTEYRFEKARLLARWWRR